METYKVHGKVVMDIYVEVEAEDIEEAIDICESGVGVKEYCDGSIGVESDECAVESIETYAWGNSVSWEECA